MFGFVLRSRLAKVVFCAFALTAPAASAHAASATSSNWSGYAITPHGSATTFRSVSGSWVVPQGTCTPGQEGYTSVWVGIGGNSQTSEALEQTGTEFDCSMNGEATYSAWYELVPDASHDIAIPVEPGDQIDAAVTVRGTRVTVLLRNRTRLQTFKRTFTMGAPDVTSAEWIVEAPADCDPSGQQCRQLPISNFGTLAFTHAFATTTKGHRGTIADSRWSRTRITLSGDGGSDYGPGPGPNHVTSLSSGAGAVASALTLGGAAFSVAYTPAT